MAAPDLTAALAAVATPDLYRRDAASGQRHDPARRIVAELFSLWPAGDDPAAELHNRAVTAHATAVEAADAGLWSSAYRLWRAVLDEDACWDRLRERVGVSSDDVEALRGLVPRTLLTVHARLAAEAGPEPALRQLPALYRSGFDQRLIDTVLRAVAAEHPSIADELASGLREFAVAEVNASRGADAVRRAEVGRFAVGRLETAADMAVGADARIHVGQDLAVVLNNLVVAMCDKALDDGDARPGACRTLQEDLVERTRAHLARVEELAPHAADRMRDDVVGTSLVLLFKYATETGDLETTLDALRRLGGHVAGTRLRGELAEAVDALESATGGPSTRDLFARPARSRSGPCVLCGRPATTERLVRLVSPSGTPVDVRLPSCTSCAGRPIETFAHRLVAAMAVSAASALALAGGIATGFTYDGVLVWILALVTVAGASRLLSYGRRARRGELARHPEIRRLLARGHRIAR